MDSVLNYGPAFNDKSSPAAMQDDFALHICSMKTLLILIEKEEWRILAVLFPHTIMTHICLSEQLSSVARIKLCDLILQFLCKLQSLQGSLKMKNSLKSNDVSFLSEIAYVRTKNTIIAFAHALMFHSEGLGLDRLGTHLVEFFSDVPELQAKEMTPLNDS
jgi:hypothetical protein